MTNNNSEQGFSLAGWLANRAYGQPGAMFLFGAMVVLLCASLWYGAEDYSTNVRGYRDLGMNDTYQWTVYVVGVLPQATQVILGYMLVYGISEISLRWQVGAWLAWITAHLTDLGLDVYARIGGTLAATPFGVFAFKVLLIEGVYGMGSEVFMSISLAFFVAWYQLHRASGGEGAFLLSPIDPSLTWEEAILAVRSLVGGFLGALLGAKGTKSTSRPASRTRKAPAPKSRTRSGGRKKSSRSVVRTVESTPEPYDDVYPRGHEGERKLW